MGIIASVFGKKPKGPPGVADAEQALERLHTSRESAKARIVDLDRRRAALLPIDGNDAEIDKVSADRSRAELEIERLAAIEPVLLGELAAARSRAKAEKWEEIQGLTWPAADRLVEAMKAANAAWAELSRLAGEARTAGLNSEAAAMFIAPSPHLAIVIMPDFYQTVQTHFDRQRSIAETIKRPQAAEPPRALPPPASAKAGAKVRVRLLAHDVETFGGAPPGNPGEERVVDEDQAEKWARAGQAKILGAAKGGRP